MIILEAVAKTTAPNTAPAYSPYGYIIQRDGTVHAMLQRWTHGLVLAFLYPEQAAAFRFDTEKTRWSSDTDEEGYKSDQLFYPQHVDQVNVYEFQEFEHWLAEQEVDGKRVDDTAAIGLGRMMGPDNVSWPSIGCSPQQIEAIRAVFRGQETRGHHKVNTSFGDLRLTTLWDYLPLTYDEATSKRYGPGGDYEKEQADGNDDMEDEDDGL